jgi:hypothetical protein
MVFQTFEQKVKIKSGKSTNVFDAGQSLGRIFPYIFLLDKLQKIVYISFL